MGQVQIKEVKLFQKINQFKSIVILESVLLCPEMNIQNYFALKSKSFELQSHGNNFHWILKCLNKIPASQKDLAAPWQQSINISFTILNLSLP